MMPLQPGSDEWVQEQFALFCIEEKMLIPVTEEQIARLDFDEVMASNAMFTDTGLCGGPDYFIPQDEVQQGYIRIPAGMVLPTPQAGFELCDFGDEEWLEQALREVGIERYMVNGWEGGIAYIPANKEQLLALLLCLDRLANEEKESKTNQ